MSALRLWSRVDDVRMWLLCLPPAGGGARLFSTWPTSLPRGLGVAALELPGRGGRIREPLATSVEDIVTEMAREARPLFDRPVMIFGHSMGAIIALDLARVLRAEQDKQPLALIAAASEAPDQQIVPAGAGTAPDELIISWLRQWGGTSEDLFASPEFLAQVLPVVRADLALMECREHRDEPPLDCPIRVYLGAADQVVNGASAELGWTRYTVHGKSARVFPGGHFFVQESAALVIAALAQDADEAVGGQLLRSR